MVDNNQEKVDRNKTKLQENTDWFLQQWVSVVNGNEFAFPVTLNVGGMLISGEMVSGHKYFEGFANDFKKLFRDEIEEDSDYISNIINSITDMGNKIYLDEANAEINETKQSEPHYIHMRNTKFYHSGKNPIPSNQGVWWRGRIEAVDGFCLGILGVD